MGREHEQRRAQPAPAGEVAVAHLREHVESLRRAVDGLGQQLARQPAQRHALARIAVGEQQVRPEPAEVREAVERNAHPATPDRLHLHALQRGEQARHLRLHACAQVARGPAVVADLAAVHEALFGRKVIIIEHEVRVRHRVVARQRPCDLFRVERLGRDHIIAHRHELGAQRGIQFIQIGVAGEHDEIRPHRAGGRFHARRLPRLDSRDRTPFVQHRARRLGRAGETEGVIERMQAPRPGLIKPAAVIIRADMILQRVAIEQPQLVVAVIPR
jgi:hypothetical protein